MSLFSLFRSLAFSLVSKTLPNYLLAAISSSSSSRTYDSLTYLVESFLHYILILPFFLFFSLSCILSFTRSLSHTHSFSLSLLDSFFLSLDPKSVNVTLRGMHEWVDGYGEEAFEKGGRRRWIYFIEDADERLRVIKTHVTTR